MNNSSMFLLVGRLTADVEVKTGNEGRTFAFPTIAVQRNYKNAQGEYDTDFFTLSLNGKQCEFVSKHFHKGDVISVSGELKTRQSKIKFDKEGTMERSISQVVLDVDNVCFVPGTRTSANANANQAQPAPAQPAPSAVAQQPFVPSGAEFPGFDSVDEEDDGLPF